MTLYFLCWILNHFVWFAIYDQITRKSFPEPEYDLVPFHSIYDTVHAIMESDEKALQPSLAVVPIENSSFGPVEETHEVLKEPSVIAKTQRLDRELKLKIQHCLVARKPINATALSVVSPEHENYSIQRIYSHVQALGQCQNYLALHYPKVERVSTSSTTEAAELVAQDATYSSLAICSATSLEYFPKLSIIDSNIQDAGQENVTTFIILKRRN